jgi:hypothetical protein
MRTEKLKGEGYNGIYFEAMFLPPNKCSIVSENALRIPVAFDQQRYESLAPGEHHEFFIGMLCEGLEKCSAQFSIPRTAIMQWIEEFRRGGYKNEWTHKTKLLRPAGIRATLLCRLDIERFVLTLRLERKGAVVFDEVILETEPDEIIFAGDFKDVVLVDNTVVVTDKFGRPTFSLSLDSLSEPEIH